MMECKFQVGQKVVCVGDLAGYLDLNVEILDIVELPKLLSVYTIREIVQAELTDSIGLRLVEIPDQMAMILFHGMPRTVELVFNHTIFRPLETRKTDIEVFQKIRRAVENKQPSPIDA